MRPTINLPITLLLLFITPFLLSQNIKRDSLEILKPTGRFSVGTLIYEWTDENRKLELTNHPQDKRTIIAQIWYPAEVDANSKIAPYSALSNDYRFVISNSYSRPAFNSSVNSSNLILISPGRGTERYLYTTIIEELASHGFVVVSIDMPEIGYTIYKDGFIVPPSSKYQPPGGMMGGPYEKVDKFFEQPTQAGYQDLEFAFKKIFALNDADPSNRFTGKIDCSNVGVFGHSLGGRIAGDFASKNNSVKAYISMEGIPPRKVRYDGLLDIPVAMLCSSGTWPYAKENYFSLIDNRSNTVYMIELPDFGHNSVTDNPYIYPEYYKYTVDAVKGLELSRKIVLDYFNDILRKKVSFKNSLADIQEIKYSVYH
jgi:hypothetical protein